jgi:tetratricopeptide (TPR) repeat protein
MFKFILSLIGIFSIVLAQTQDIYINAGFRRMEEGDYSSALVYLNKAVQLEPGKARGYYKRAFLKTMQGELKSAMFDLDTALLKEPDYSPVYYLRAEVLEGIGKREMALREISRYIQQNPRDLNGYEFKIDLLQKEKSERSALLTADDMVANNPDLSLSWKTRGRIRETQLDGPGALKDYDKCLELSGRDSVCLIHRASLRFDMGDAIGASIDYTAYLSRYPDNPDFWVNLSEARAIIKDTLGAIRALDSALLKKVDDPGLFLSRGYFLLTQKKYEPAEMDYIRALEMNTDERALALFNKGLCLFYMQRISEACADWNQAANATPHLEEARLWLKKHCLQKK